MLVRSLGLKDPLEEGTATPVLPEESHGQRNLVGYSLETIGSPRLRQD